MCAFKSGEVKTEVMNEKAECRCKPEQRGEEVAEAEGVVNSHSLFSMKCFYPLHISNGHGVMGKLMVKSVTA